MVFAIFTQGIYYYHALSCIVNSGIAS